jgi:hypothetical protein
VIKRALWLDLFPSVAPTRNGDTAAARGFAFGISLTCD